MSDDSSFVVAGSPVWEENELDFDEDKDMDDTDSVIDGVVDDDFLMMLDDAESVAGPETKLGGMKQLDNLIKIEDEPQFQSNYEDDDDLNRDPLDQQDFFHVTQVQQQQNYQQPYFNGQQQAFQRQQQHFQAQMPQRQHSFQQEPLLPLRPNSFHNQIPQEQPLPQRELPLRGHSFHQHDRFVPLSTGSLPFRGRLSHTQSATFAHDRVPMRLSERFPDRIPENAPSFYEQPPTLPSMTQHQSFMAEPRSPIPNEINIFASPKRNTCSQQLMFNERTQLQAPAFRVTPEPTNSSISLPDPLELQMQYQRTLKRLGRSMRRSDATRSIVKRQRSGYSTCSNLSGDSERSGNLFSSDTMQVEEARRRLYQLISHQS